MHAPNHPQQPPTRKRRRRRSLLLSFLGFGIQPPTASWGNMLSGALDNITRAPWLIVAPGIFIWFTVLCIFLLADGLRDALDPRLKE